MKKRLSLAFTGHRPDKLGGYGHAAHRRLVVLARQVIIAIDPDEVISGMALGWDQAVAQAAIDLSVPFVAAIPFRGQDSRWRSDSRQVYERLLGEAKGSVLIFDGQPSDAEVPRAMQKRNEWMVDNSDRLIALWNGTSGGTANCVRYAERRGKQIDNLWGCHESNLPLSTWWMLT